MSPIPDFLTTLTEEEILDRMLSTYPGGTDVSEGSFPWTNNSPASIELAIANERARLVLEWGFAQTTFGEFLDLKSEEHGVIRHAPRSAEIEQQQFTGVPGTIIPAGFEVSTPSTEAVDAIIFAVDEEAVIGGGGTVVVSVTAVLAGAEGNVPIAQVTAFDDLDGLAGTTNLTAGIGGLDEETDQALLVRLLLKVRNPGTSGNVADYLNWSLEVAGVGAAAVVPLEDGPGTVTVAIADVNKEVPDVSLVDEVQEYIAPGGLDTGTGKAPIGASVTVEAAIAVDIDVDADLTVAVGYVEADVQNAAEGAIADYLKSLAFVADNDVRHARVVSAILDVAGVSDVTGLTLNGGGGNVAIGAKEIAVLGDVTWT